MTKLSMTRNGDEAIMDMKPIVVALALGFSGVALANPAALTVDEAAAWLKAPRAEVEALAERGELPGRKIGAAGWRFDAEALQAWLAGAPAPSAPDTDIGKGKNEQPVHTPPRPVQDPIPKGRLTIPTAEETALREVSLTGKPGSFTAELALAHSFDDSGSGSLALFGGRAETRTTMATMGLSYRMDDRTQIFAQLPYASQRTKMEDLAAGEVVRSSKDGAQSLSLGIRRVLLAEDVGRPQVLATLEASVPLQTGLRKRLAMEVSVLKSLDPVTVFATLRADRAFGEVGVDARSQVALGLGYVYALNDLLAVSTSLNIRDADTVDTSGLGWHRQSHYELKLGMPTSFNGRGWFLEPHVSFGLNRSNSAVAVGVSVVKTFAR